jgi:DNA-binding IscR family transcriptional regulator
MLADSDGNMERSSLRRRVGWKYSILDPVLEELEKEGKIKIAVGKQGGYISLKR